MNSFKSLLIFVLLIFTVGVLNEEFEDVQSCGHVVTRRGHSLVGPRVFRGSFPWNAALLKNQDELFCFGTLISSTKIATAAHCIHPSHLSPALQPHEIKVHLGFHNINDPNESERLAIAVSQIQLHSDWNQYTYEADIAILELEREVSFGRYVQPICLIEPGSNVTSVLNGAVVGFENDGSPTIVDVSIDSGEDCRKIVDNLGQRRLCGIISSGIEIGEKASGSGLVISDGNQFYLRGIVSEGVTHNGTVVIFTDPEKFFDWLRN